MENNRKQKPQNSVVYILTVFMLVTIIVIAVISAVGTANITDEKITTDTHDEIITNRKDNDNPKDDKPEVDTDGTSQNTDTSSEDTTGVDTHTHDDSSPASAPLEFCLPVTGYISKDYSIDLPVFSLTMNDYRTHSGLDIQAAVGSAVATVAQGEITDRYTDPFMGICVEVTHGGGLVSRYMNLGEEFPSDAQVGCKVYCGQTIACIGESAAVEAADTSHLHFELLQDGKNVDPLDYISYEPMTDEYSE